MKVTVFGSAQPRPGDPAYEEALCLGRLLASEGHTVLTGGYMGTMEAVSRGAVDAGGHAIGVTCQEIETWRQTKANPWVREEWYTQTLSERIDRMIEGCDAAMALNGGPGTLTEVSLMWNRMTIHATRVRPLILIGPAWQHTFETMFSSLDSFIANGDRSLLSFANDVECAVRMLQEA
jgi:uncharacterized protein (TIGR00730 family)